MRDAQVPELYDRVLSLAPPPPQVPFQMHLVQEPPFSDKGSMGATLCRMAEELEAAAVVGSSGMLRHRGGGGAGSAGKLQAAAVGSCLYYAEQLRGGLVANGDLRGSQRG